MLDLSTAVLCDFAQVRDRLLFVSSGAVSRLYRRELPSPLGLMVGLVIEVPLEESGVEHTLRADVVNRHGAVLATLQNTFRVGDEGLFPHEVQQVPLVLSITGVRARTWGTHQVRLSLDDELVRALTLYVVPAAGVEPSRPPARAAEPAPAEPVAEPEAAQPEASDLEAAEPESEPQPEPEATEPETGPEASDAPAEVETADTDTTSDEPDVTAAADAETDAADGEGEGEEADGDGDDDDDDDEDEDAADDESGEGGEGEGGEGEGDAGLGRHGRRGRRRK